MRFSSLISGSVAAFLSLTFLLSAKASAGTGSDFQCRYLVAIENGFLSQHVKYSELRSLPANSIMRLIESIGRILFSILG